MRWEAIILLILHLVMLACFMLSKPPPDQQAAKFVMICFSAMAISLTISLGVS